MRNAVLIMLTSVVVLLALCQLILPGLAERKVKDRIESDGGTARVSVSAFPAVRLLFGDGDELEVRGRGTKVDLSRREKVLERLDGFDSVDVRITDMDAGPLAVSRFELLRGEGDGQYQVRMDAETSPREVAGFLGSQAGGLLGGVLGDLAAGRLPSGGTEHVPMHVTAAVVSRNGDVGVTSASGSVAGVPAGPLAEIMVQAVAREL